MPRVLEASWAEPPRRPGGARSGGPAALPGARGSLHCRSMVGRWGPALPSLSLAPFCVALLHPLAPRGGSLDEEGSQDLVCHLCFHFEIPRPLQEHPASCLETQLRQF